MNNCNAPAAKRIAALRSRGLLLAVLLAAPALGAEPDICENKAGQELIRCIEAAARAETGTPAPAPKTTAPAARPAPAARDTPAVPNPPAGLAHPRAEDCTGRSGEALRRCLAAGGRLTPAAPPAAAAPAASAAALSAGNGSCEGKSGEALRQCVQAQSKNPAPAARKAARPQPVACTGYTAADQPLCVHRNSAIVECRNRSLYPDFDVCLRSHMFRAPEPPRADCGALPARTRAHCEARNRVYASCSGDKLNYFACLERHLGADAVLTRR